jgi:hypothetical protein
MPFDFSKLTIGHWILLVPVWAMMVLCLIQFASQVNLSARIIDKHKRNKMAWIAGVYGYGFGVSVFILVGILLGANIYSLECWAWLIPLLIILSPMIVIFYGGAHSGMIRQDYYRNLAKKMQAESDARARNQRAGK